LQLLYFEVAKCTLYLYIHANEQTQYADYAFNSGLHQLETTQNTHTLCKK